jgi:hypothetical protein
MVLGEPVLDVIRRELRRVSPDVRIEKEQIRAVLMQEVLKREGSRERRLTTPNGRSRESRSGA